MLLARKSLAQSIPCAFKLHEMYIVRPLGTDICVSVLEVFWSLTAIWFQFSLVSSLLS